MAPPPGRMPRSEPSAVPRRTGPMIRLKSAFDSIRPLTCLTMTRAGMLVLQVAQDLAEAEDAHAERHEVEAVGHLRHVEGEALGAGLDVGADQPEQQAQHDHGEGLEQRAAGQRHRGDQAQHHQREVFRRAELEAPPPPAAGPRQRQQERSRPCRRRRSRARRWRAPGRRGPVLAIW